MSSDLSQAQSIHQSFSKLSLGLKQITGEPPVLHSTRERSFITESRPESNTRMNGSPSTLSVSKLSLDLEQVTGEPPVLHGSRARTFIAESRPEFNTRMNGSPSTPSVSKSTDIMLPSDPSQINQLNGWDLELNRQKPIEFRLPESEGSLSWTANGSPLTPSVSKSIDIMLPSDPSQINQLNGWDLELNRLKPIEIRLPESERSLSWTAVIAINEAISKHDPKIPISQFSNSAEYKAMCQLKDPPRPQHGNVPRSTLPLPRTSSTPASKQNMPQSSASDRRRICDEIRHIIIKRIPEDERGSYTHNKIIRQAAILEALLFKHKLSYEWYVDMTTLERRVIHAVNMSLAPWKYNMKLPKLIVKIDTEMK